MRPRCILWLLSAWFFIAGCSSTSGVGVEDGLDGEPTEDGSTGGDPGLGLDAGDDSGISANDADGYQPDGTVDAGPGDEGADIDPGDAGGDLGPGDQGGLPCLSGEVPTLTALTPEELYVALEDKDFLLINVASASGGQIAGTDTFIPHDDTEALVEFIGPDLHTHVVLYCVSSRSSGIAGQALVDLDYCSIQHLEGGMNAWVAAGYPLE